MYVQMLEPQVKMSPTIIIEEQLPATKAKVSVVDELLVWKIRDETGCTATGGYGKNRKKVKTCADVDSQFFGSWRKQQINNRL